MALVDPFLPRDGEPMPISDYRAALSEAHGYLVGCGAEAMRRAADLEAGRAWGTRAKRIRVLLPLKDRPGMIGAGMTEHNLAEVVNQCATIERLLDALAWAQTEPSLSEHLVERCHPTTSSSREDEEDHDLVLIAPDETGAKAKFEVSDVASEKDSNSKEKKDLESLGILLRGPGHRETSEGWPSGRLFLIVSEEFAVWLHRHRAKPVHYHYEDVKLAGTTRIFEVKQGT